MTRSVPIVLAWLMAAGSSASRSAEVPALLGVDPPGATIGRFEDWTLIGRHLDGVDKLLVSGSGIEVVEFANLGDSKARARVRVAPDAPIGYREVRLDGPGGISNLVLIRVDTLRQLPEADRRGDRSKAQEVDVGWAVSGLLEPRDVDLYRVRGTPGRRLTLDLEARRLGTSIAPVLTALAESGVATAQAREPRGGDRDVRLGVTVPLEGSFLVQVRDNTYGGSDQARYRLRIDPSPYASAWFPLGGRRGTSVEVEVSGGGLSTPLKKTVTLPDLVGSTVEVGPVDGPSGPILGTGRLVASDGLEVFEPAAPTPGVTVNGRISRPGEVDVYRVPVKGGERFRTRIEAEALGSWLDSVVTIRDQAGALLLEGDDAEDVRPAPKRPHRMGSDSSVDFEPKSDGFLTIEVSDRFDDGGPEFGYRLTVGPPRPDFSVTLPLGPSGAFNLRPGSSIPIPFVIEFQGRPGPVEVRIEGLPPGVSAESVTVRPPGSNRSGSSPLPSAVADSLRLRVARDASPGLAEFRVMAMARAPSGPALVRRATATLDIAAAPGTRPISRTLDRFPIRILAPGR